MPSRNSRRAFVIYAAMLIATLVLDQRSKAWASGLPTDPAGCAVSELAAQRCHGVPQPAIAGVMEWQLAMNDGVAFSTFRGKAIVLSLLAMAALVMLGVMAARTAPEQRMKRVALAMIAGGALGNLVDRLREGAVIDFVRLRAGDHVWPIFNVADVALVVGVGLLVLETALARRRPATLRT
ncbi:MAG: signal peptidase II [Kofleriaceae bacterium]